MNMNSQSTPIRRVCVLTGDHHLPDATKPDSQYGELDLKYHHAMQAALQSLAPYEFEFLTDHGQLLTRMQDDPPDFVLNLCDTGYRNIATFEMHIPCILEILGIPYSGATPACMALCYDKGIVRLAAESLGIATPSELFVSYDQDSDVLDKSKYPALVKPNRADGSVGITQDSVVQNATEAKSYIRRLRQELGECDVLVQEYLPGPEYGLVLVGNPGNGFFEPPLLTIDFSELPNELPPILGYESKTDPASPYWTGSQIVAADLEPHVVSSLRRDSRRLFQRLQCQDYARFDWRVRADGEIALMEVNPNPAWDPDAKLAHMFSFAGLDYPKVFEKILDAAQQRLSNV